MLPILGFADYFALNNSYEPSQNFITVTNEGSFFAENFSLSFGTVHNSEFLEYILYI